jgi:hypothetical protein
VFERECSGEERLVRGVFGAGAEGGGVGKKPGNIFEAVNGSIRDDGVGIIDMETAGEVVGPDSRETDGEDGQRDPP